MESGVRICSAADGGTDWKTMELRHREIDPMSSGIWGGQFPDGMGIEVGVLPMSLVMADLLGNRQAMECERI